MEEEEEVEVDVGDELAGAIAKRVEGKKVVEEVRVVLGTSLRGISRQWYRRRGRRGRRWRSKWRARASGRERSNRYKTTRGVPQASFTSDWWPDTHGQKGDRQ